MTIPSNADFDDAVIIARECANGCHVPLCERNRAAAILRDFGLEAWGLWRDGDMNLEHRLHITAFCNRITEQLNTRATRSAANPPPCLIEKDTTTP